MNLVINWDVTPELIEGWKTPNYYGLLFVTGLMIGYFVCKRMFKREGVHEKYLDQLVLYVIVATIVGARLGHVLFYGPYWDTVDLQGVVLEQGYFSHPASILYIWEGGLASHGGAIALLLAFYIYSKRVVKLPIIWILDRIVAPIAIAACFIRFGNLMNSEIVGDPTTVPWAFSFPNYYNEVTHQYDSTPRHPAQLYEALSYIVIFLTLMFMYWKRKAYEKRGMLFGSFLILLFGARFFIEFIKLGQTDRDAEFAINTGQMLSIPFVIAGIIILYFSMKKKHEPFDVSGIQADSKSIKDSK